MKQLLFCLLICSSCHAQNRFEGASNRAVEKTNQQLFGTRDLSYVFAVSETPARDTVPVDMLISVEYEVHAAPGFVVRERKRLPRMVYASDNGHTVPVTYDNFDSIDEWVNAEYLSINKEPIPKNWIVWQTKER